MSGMSFLTNTEVRVQYIDHIEKKKIRGHHGNLKDIVYRTMGCLYEVFPCREFKIHDSHLKPGKYVQWD